VAVAGTVDFTLARLIIMVHIPFGVFFQSKAPNFDPKERHQIPTAAPPIFGTISLNHPKLYTVDRFRETLDGRA